MERNTTVNEKIINTSGLHSLIDILKKDLESYEKGEGYISAFDEYLPESEQGKLHHVTEEKIVMRIKDLARFGLEIEKAINED